MSKGRLLIAIMGCPTGFPTLLLVRNPSTVTRVSAQSAAGKGAGYEYTVDTRSDDDSRADRVVNREAPARDPFRTAGLSARVGVSLPTGV